MLVSRRISGDIAAESLENHCRKNKPSSYFVAASNSIGADYDQGSADRLFCFPGGCNRELVGRVMMAPNSHLRMTFLFCGNYFRAEDNSADR
jgi:hypothetical protein